LTLLDEATTWSGNMLQQTPSERVQYPRAEQQSCHMTASHYTQDLKCTDAHLPERVVVVI